MERKKNRWSWAEKPISCRIVGNNTFIIVSSFYASNFRWIEYKVQSLFIYSIQKNKVKLFDLLIELSIESVAYGIRPSTQLFDCVCVLPLNLKHLHLSLCTVHPIKITLGHYVYCFDIRNETDQYNVWWPPPTNARHNAYYLKQQITTNSHSKVYW